MEHLWNTLYPLLDRAMHGAAPFALAGALVWGALSVVLSPCHLSSIPLIVGFISEQGTMTTRKAFGLSLMFGLGILTTIAAIGVATSVAGHMLMIGKGGTYVLAAVFFIVGLHLIGVIPMPVSGPGSVGLKRKGFLASFILGLVFGIALGPCTFAFMAPVLALTLGVAAAAPVFAALLLVAYGVGHCSVIVAAGTSAEAVQKYLNWNEKSKGTTIIKRICGILVVLGGVYLIYAAN